MQVTELGACLYCVDPNVYWLSVACIPDRLQPGLASFCRFVEKTGFFHGKSRPGKNSFLPGGKNHPAKKLVLQTFARWKK
jgi:hypothetical protein